jgi:hypothetical protein
MCGISAGIGTRTKNWNYRDWERDQKLKLAGSRPGPNQNPKLYEIVNSVIFGRHLIQIFKKIFQKTVDSPPIFGTFGVFGR